MFISEQAALWVSLDLHLPVCWHVLGELGTTYMKKELFLQDTDLLTRKNVSLNKVVLLLSKHAQGCLILTETQVLCRTIYSEQLNRQPGNGMGNWHWD